MCSLSQFEANRANAQRSTGPTSPQGKAISSRNATRHGLYAVNPVTCPGDQELFDEHHAGLIAELRPSGPEQERLVYLIADADFRVFLAQRLENALWERDHVQHPRQDGQTFEDWIASSYDRLQKGASIHRLWTIQNRYRGVSQRLHDKFAKLRRDSAPASSPKPAPSRREPPAVRNEPNFDPLDSLDWLDAAPPQPVRVQKQVYKNSKCPCGSGKKYAKCCRQADLARKKAI